MNYEENTNDDSERATAKAKATWFSAEDVCILADLVRSHSDALRNLANSPSRNEKKKVWEVIAQLLAEKTNVPRTTRQVQKKWSNLRSAVRRASRNSVGTAVLPHYFLPVVKFLEEENELDVNASQEIHEEDVYDLPQNVQVLQHQSVNGRQTYAVKIRHLQEQQEAEVERFAVLKQIKLEAAEENEEVTEIPDDEEIEAEHELQFSHVAVPDAEDDHSNTEHLASGNPAPIWISESGENIDTGADQSVSEDFQPTYFQPRQGSVTRNRRGAQKRPRPWPENCEDKSSGDETRQMQMELLKAQLLLVQKETSLKEREIQKKDKEISLLDKEILKVDLEIKFMRKKHLWEEMKMRSPKK